MNFYNDIESKIDITRDIRNNFKEYLKSKNIPIIEKNSIDQKEFISPCNVGLVFSLIGKYKWCKQKHEFSI